MNGFVERSSYRHNNAPRRAGLSRVAEDLSAMRVTTPTPPPSATGSSTLTVGGRRRKSRSPGSMRARTDANTITTIVGKKRKSTASSSSGATASLYNPDDLVVDRGRKIKLKPKTQSRHSVENCMSIAEQQPPQNPYRPTKKQRSQSRDSREQFKKHPLSETSGPGDKSSGNSESAELSRVKKELEAVKKVRSHL